ncbi:hypothetical protein SAICODRAFT_9293 [Saitoella complicata NRRL Y-17804]|uniref:Delta(24)-sterol reductase n=1 Tax=Saitoella complicata (strain BCRC 22490 / CBS 7301 / JCM 7358 / NBRC 10748 / NRRL Y-17804) TaxID=698492 RepID=A0A0E9NJS3_SAICN|nr:uncharacterized protein SAICODRAFT_9293 [Saitoella complicata NRRL Y-17804]ODQ50963.1 hypothetical protein SAICODRAFT_9293 [Saitoella complicata NRRL Y-17804]GAO49655.1 hypothetical protein G7K_3803-t1 [Saitoella complicata NRRL Y-17804]
MGISWSQLRSKLLLTWSITCDLTHALFNSPFLLLRSLYTIYLRPALTPTLSLDPAPRVKSLREHQEEVEVVRRGVEVAREAGRKVVMGRQEGEGHVARGRGYKDGAERISMSHLNALLSIAVESRVAHVEPLVTFAGLCTATLEKGFLPAVVPEFRSITVGGAIQGLGIESSSWRNSTFDTSVTDATLIAGDAQIRTAKDDGELWSAVPGSCGTVALVAGSEVQLEKASPWMRVRYVRYRTPSEFGREADCKIGSLSSEQGEDGRSWMGSDAVMDAIAFEHGTIGMFGGCVTQEEAERLVGGSMGVYKDHPGRGFFFSHVEQIAKRDGGYVTSDTREKRKEQFGEVIHEELIPTLEYLFRYDKGGFWAVHALSALLPPLRLLLSRLLLPLFNTFLSTSTLYKVALLMSDQKRENVSMLQDVDIPYSEGRFEDFVEWEREEIGVWPLWLCPVRGEHEPRVLGLGHKASDSSNPRNEDAQGRSWVMNVGLYGIPRSPRPLVDLNIELERKVTEMGGKKGLYAFVYADKEYFWSGYDREGYDAVRRKYGSEGVMMELWEKVRVRF